MTAGSACKSAPRPCLLCSTLRCVKMTTNVAVLHATHVPAVSHRSVRSKRSAISGRSGRLLRSAATRRSGLLQRSAISQGSLPSRRYEVSTDLPDLTASRCDGILSHDAPSVEPMAPGPSDYDSVLGPAPNLQSLKLFREAH